MDDKDTVKSKIGTVIFVVSIIIILLFLFSMYKKYYYNDFLKAELNPRQTVFTRDNEIKYLNYRSYKVESKSYNDAVFYKTVNVKPNTPYKVTCMVKTENVETEKKYSSSGVQIGLMDSTECSNSIVGTNDWKLLEFIFNSKDKQEIKIGFRLGGNNDNAKGTAWFSDIKIEEGNADINSNWNMACFIIKNVELKAQDDIDIKLQISLKDVETIKLNMSRFKNVCKEFSERQNDCRL